MKMQILVSAVSSFLLVQTACVCAAGNSVAEGLDLKLRLKPGQKYSVRHTHKVKHQNDSFLYVRDLSFEVQDADANGIATIKVTYQTLRMDITRESFDGGCGVKLARPISVGIQYDSTKQSLADDDPNLPVIEAAGVGESFTIKVAPNGRIVSLEGLEQMHSRIIDRVIAWDKKHFGKKMAKALEQIRPHNTRSTYSEREIRNMLTDVFMSFPEKPLEIGHSWSDKVGIWGKNEEIDGTYTLENISKDSVVVDLKAKRTAEQELFSWVNNEGREVGFRLVGSCTGRFEIDRQSGWLAHGKVEMQFAGQVIDDAQGEKVAKPILEQEVITVEPIVRNLVN